MAYLEHEPTSTLFQFTSVDGFKGILKSKSLWFSDLRSLNDPRELILGLGTVREVIDDILERNSEDWDIVSFRKILSQCYKTFENLDYFSCSFCPTGDSMPLWQHYGVQGEGVSVGFRPRAITDLPCRIQKIEYLNRDTPIEDMQKNLEAELAKLQSIKGDSREMEGVKLSSKILSLCTSVKHSTWDHEREVRAIYSQAKERRSVEFMSYVTSLHSDGTEQKWTEPLERSSGEKTVRYLPFKFGKIQAGSYDPTRAIEKVVVGPNSKLSVPEAEALLASEGFRVVSVVTSECLWR